MKYICLTNAENIYVFMMVFIFFYQDALSAELNNLGMNYEKELLEKPPLTSNEQKNQSGHSFVDRDQFLR